MEEHRFLKLYRDSGLRKQSSICVGTSAHRVDSLALPAKLRKQFKSRLNFPSDFVSRNWLRSRYLGFSALTVSVPISSYRYLEQEFPLRIGNFKRRSRSGERSFGFVSANMDWQVSHTSFKPGSEQARDARYRCILSSESPPSMARELGLLATVRIYDARKTCPRYDMKYHRR